MDQVEIEHVATQLLDALVKGAQRFVEAVIRIAEFRRHENVGPSEQGLADALLVSIHRRRIDEAIAFIDRHLHHLLRLIRRRLENAKPELRHGRAVVEAQRRLGLIGHTGLSRFAARDAEAVERKPGRAVKEMNHVLYGATIRTSVVTLTLSSELYASDPTLKNFPSPYPYIPKCFSRSAQEPDRGYTLKRMILVLAVDPAKSSSVSGFDGTHSS